MTQSTMSKYALFMLYCCKNHSSRVLLEIAHLIPLFNSSNQLLRCEVLNKIELYFTSDNTVLICSKLLYRNKIAIKERGIQHIFQNQTMQQVNSSCLSDCNNITSQSSYINNFRQFLQICQGLKI